MSIISLGSNINSFRAQRKLNETSNQLSKVFERLSSGQRINRASDDAAGLAISQKLNLDKSVFLQGVRNINDGTSILNVADSALESLTGIVSRIQELATQASNGTFTATQRNALDAEAQALSKEFFRISRSTTFNGIELFDGSIQEYRFQAGYGTDGGIASGLGGSLGNGTFSGYRSYASETTSGRVTLGDLNNDGHLDMVTNGNNGSTGYATVRMGLGDGTFGSATSYNQENAVSRDIILGDVNNDGVLDLVTSGNEDTLVASITVRLGIGDGTFGSSTSKSFFLGSGNMRGVAIADVNSDGKMDLIGAREALPGYAYIALGNGDGTFDVGTSSLIGANNSAYALTMADLNNDGIQDIITAVDNSALTGGIAVKLGLGNGTFGATILNATIGSTARDVDVGDFNNDGIMDAITVYNNGSAVLHIGNGDGTFKSPTAYSNGTTGSYGVVATDLNGDGNLDFLTTDLTGGLAEATFVRLGNGDGSFNAVRSFTSLSGITGGIAVGDLNEDGVMDVVVNGVSNAIVRIQSTIQGVAPILPFSLKTVADARQAMAPLERKMEQLSSQRGTVGAFQSRLGVAVNVLSATSDNYDAANSRIIDADVAQDSADLVRLNILQQSASAILAQANNQPELVLRLLTS